MDADTFIKRWDASTRNETAGSKPHFLDLCALLDVPLPTDDPTGAIYAFEKQVAKANGRKGWADVWFKGRFGWEYKSKGRDLEAAHDQLLRYAGALENPPLLVTSDMARIVVRTNFTNTVTQATHIDLEALRDAPTRDRLRDCWLAPDRWKPGTTRQALTERAAGDFAELAERLRKRGHAAEAVAHFVNRLVFCLFANDVRLLPNGMLGELLALAQKEPDSFADSASMLFRAMSERGGRIGFRPVPWFNGGLFDDDATLPLMAEDIALMNRAATNDWSQVDPSIFGTLFERGLDPSKRSQLGAHYTDRGKIELLVEAVITRPLAAEWAAVRSDIAVAMSERAAVLKGSASAPAAALVLAEADAITAETQAARKDMRRASERRTRKADAFLADADKGYRAFLERLRAFRVLDPACGSGNFLYVSMLALKDLELRVSVDAEAMGLDPSFPAIGPEAVLGIEVNSFAAELARVSVWIGHIQWARRHGYPPPSNPVLRKLDTIECRDAVLALDGSEAVWPEADVIVGNPPFCGVKHQLQRLGSEYMVALRKVFDGRLPALDLVGYWFEKAREKIKQGHCSRFGFVATRTIRKGANRTVLDRIVEDAEIYEAWENQNWVLDGAAVRVCLICFSSHGSNTTLIPRLDGKEVRAIRPDLTEETLGGVNLLHAETLAANQHTAFIGAQLSGPFGVDGETARMWLKSPANPSGRHNSEVVRPLIGGDDITGRSRDEWAVDFGASMRADDAALYEGPFKYVQDNVFPVRQKEKRPRRKKLWWLFGEPSPGMRRAISQGTRYIATSLTGRHRFFIWCHPKQLSDSSVVAIGHSEDWMLGILSSRFHQIWAERKGNNMGVGGDSRYTPTTTFNTFSFPYGMSPDLDPSACSMAFHAESIAAGARRLNEFRNNWLNPAEWTQRLPEVVAGYPDRLLPADAKAAAALKERTLTVLYNQYPKWLDNIHRDLDAAVAAAYGWPAELSDDEVLARLLALNLERAKNL